MHNFAGEAWRGKRVRRHFFVLTSLLFTLFFARLADTQSDILRNPLNGNGGADPWLVYHDGNYYLATTTWASELTMRTAPTLAELKTAVPERIYFETDSSRCCNMWAPEFHLLDGPNGPRWYFYYSAGTQGTLDNQHTHVLESAGTDPMGPYTYKARIFDPANDVWAIDGSVLLLDDSLYFLFSAWVGSNQEIFIAPMSDPWTISGERVRIASPTYNWEKVGSNVNEGPVALQHDRQTFVIFSASSCNTPDYKLGMLTYNGGDVLSEESWVKHPDPVFERSDANGVYAPGHNGFFRSPDGSEDWIVYHANDSISGGCDGRRTTRVQKFTWNDDGMPNFGEPVSTDTAIANPAGDRGVDPLPAVTAPAVTRLKAFGESPLYIRHENGRAKLALGVRLTADADFVIVPGLTDSAAVSIESVNFPGWYLIHREGQLWLSADDGAADFAANATWWQRPGLADDNWSSFEAYSAPGQYLRRRFDLLLLTEITTDDDRADATFLQESQS